MKELPLKKFRNVRGVVTAIFASPFGLRKCQIEFSLCQDPLHPEP